MLPAYCLQMHDSNCSSCTKQMETIQIWFLRRTSSPQLKLPRFHHVSVLFPVLLTIILAPPLLRRRPSISSPLSGTTTPRKPTEQRFVVAQQGITNSGFVRSCAVLHKELRAICTLLMLEKSIRVLMFDPFLQTWPTPFA